MKLKLPDTSDWISSNQGTLLVGVSEGLIQESLKNWLENTTAIKQVYTGSTQAMCLELAFHNSPDLVFLPFILDDKSGVQIAIDLKKLCSEIKIAFYIDDVADLGMSNMLSCNPVGLVSIHDTPEQIIELVDQLFSGETVYSKCFEKRIQEIQNHLSDLHPRKGVLGLTPRQIEVLVYLGQGFTVKEVASKMYLSEKSIDSHKYRIMKKLDIHDRVHLARFAIREGLVEA